MYGEYHTPAGSAARLAFKILVSSPSAPTDHETGFVLVSCRSPDPQNYISPDRPPASNPTAQSAVPIALR